MALFSCILGINLKIFVLSFHPLLPGLYIVVSDGYLENMSLQNTEMFDSVVDTHERALRLFNIASFLLSSSSLFFLYQPFNVFYTWISFNFKRNSKIYVLETLTRGGSN